MAQQPICMLIKILLRLSVISTVLNVLMMALIQCLRIKSFSIIKIVVMIKRMVPGYIQPRPLQLILKVVKVPAKPKPKRSRRQRAQRNKLKRWVSLTESNRSSMLHLIVWLIYLMKLITNFMISYSVKMVLVVTLKNSYLVKKVMMAVVKVAGSLVP